MYQIIDVGNGMSKAVGKCHFTKIPHETAPFLTKDYEYWMTSSAPIQKTGLISLSETDRDFLIMSVGPDFWATIKDEDE
jgi:hypothetical protein